MTQNYVANSNEIKVKALCHNLCVLIQEMHELGVSVDFSGCVEHFYSVKKRS